LTRLFIRNPGIVLLDEPTASMDEATERKFINGFQEWSTGKTIVIATHRMRVLDLVDRIVAVDNGRIVLDAKKEIALQRLRGVSNVVSSETTSRLQAVGEA
jgi:ATP-binding cassette, subfamily C, bacterial LapB